MRLLHTSDWHLGRSFHRESLLSAQAAFADHLVETVGAERVDAVLVAGDVYDRALPPVDAVALFDDTLRRLRGLGVHTVIISGNHDSPVRLGFGAGLMDRIHLRTDPHQRLVAHRRERRRLLRDSLPGARARPDSVEPPGAHPHGRHDPRHGSRTPRRRRPRESGAGPRLRHRGAASDSERDIRVGGVAHVPLRVFDGVSYTALGHLHGRQTMSETVRYSGSPIAYSFSEADHKKGSWLVELGGAVEFVPAAGAPAPHPPARRGSTTCSPWPPSDDWIQATLTDPVRPKAAMERLRTRFPHTVDLHFAPDDVPEAAPARARLAGRPEIDVALDFVREVRGETADADERRILEEAAMACRIKETMA